MHVTYKNYKKCPTLINLSSIDYVGNRFSKATDIKKQNRTGVSFFFLLNFANGRPTPWPSDRNERFETRNHGFDCTDSRRDVFSRVASGIQANNNSRSYTKKPSSSPRYKKRTIPVIRWVWSHKRMWVPDTFYILRVHKMVVNDRSFRFSSHFTTWTVGWWLCLKKDP